MTTAKTECSKCGVSILQSTATRHQGRCKPCASGRKAENVVEGMELGMRFFLGVVFAVAVGGIGFGIGSSLATIVGVILAMLLAPIGLIYGFFCVEINAIMR